MTWRVTNDFEDSEDQGSEAEDTIRWVVITDLHSIVVNIHYWKPALQASALCREASSSRSTNPVQLEGERSLPSDDPAGMYF